MVGSICEIQPQGCKPFSSYNISQKICNFYYTMLYILVRKIIIINMYIVCVCFLLHFLHVKVDIGLDFAVLSTDFISVLIFSKKPHNNWQLETTYIYGMVFLVLKSENCLLRVIKIVGTYFKKILIFLHYSHTCDKSKQAESCLLLFHSSSVTVFQQKWAMSSRKWFQLSSATVRCLLYH